MLLPGCFPAVAAAAGDAPWLTDYHEALAQAKSENRNVLLDFTGSDWCPVCIEMEKQVFDTPQFKDYAAKNLVLLRLDFPVSHPLPQKLQDQNENLQEKYGAGDLFPVFILVDKSGKVLVRYVGRVDGGPAGFISMLQGKKA
jgi:thioredoxin-related protein